MSGGIVAGSDRTSNMFLNLIAPTSEVQTICCRLKSLESQLSEGQKLCSRSGVGQYRLIRMSKTNISDGQI